MSASANRDTVRAYIDEVLNDGNAAVLDMYFAEDVIPHNPVPGQARGIEGWRKMVMDLRGAFPDCQFTADEIIAEGDKVVVRYTIAGTHKNVFMGIAPTGKRIKVSSIAVNRLENGRIKEVWEQFDTLAMFQQMGVLPTPIR